MGIMQEIERAEHALGFTRRLSHARGWSLAFAGGVREYRRFCFLAMVSDQTVTPSEEVDEVWHQHLNYSRDYWDVWCGHVLRGALHHDPAAGGRAGGTADGRHYRAQYAETLALPEYFFGPPDLAFWPVSHPRFRVRPRYRMVDADCIVVLPHPALPGWLVRIDVTLGLASLAATLGPALAQSLNPLD